MMSKDGEERRPRSRGARAPRRRARAPPGCACSPRLRTNGVNANGATAKVMSFDRLEKKLLTGKRYALALLGRYKSVFWVRVFSSKRPGKRTSPACDLIVLFAIVYIAVCLMLSLRLVYVMFMCFVLVNVTWFVLSIDMFSDYRIVPPAAPAATAAAGAGAGARRGGLVAAFRSAGTPRWSLGLLCCGRPPHAGAAPSLGFTQPASSRRRICGADLDAESRPSGAACAGAGCDRPPAASANIEARFTEVVGRLLLSLSSLLSLSFIILSISLSLSLILSSILLI